MPVLERGEYWPSHRRDRGRSLDSTVLVFLAVADRLGGDPLAGAERWPSG
jgi:hypothetical protein